MATTSEIRAYALKHGCTDAEALKALSAAKRMAEHSPQSRNDELEKAINELCLAESVIGMTAGQIPERLINRRDAAIQRLRDLYVVSEKGPSADTERLDWLHGALFDKHWDGTIGRPCTWRMCGPYRHVLVKMVGNTFREAIDAARKENGNG